VGNLARPRRKCFTTRYLNKVWRGLSWGNPPTYKTEANKGGVMIVADTRRLPVPVTDIYDWQMQGACRGMDSAFFFHPEGERGPARASREAKAKHVCNGCAVLEQCRRHALSAHEPYGVWGGLSESERDDIIRDRDRTLRVQGRPTMVPRI
jgi:WhiB family redox-sensing transcriptional regulator